MTLLHRRISLAAAACLVMAGCGSTAQQSGSALGPSGTGTTGSGSTTGLEAPVVGGSAQPGSTTGGPVLGSTGSTTGSGSTGFVPTTGTTTGGGSSGSSTGATSGTSGTGGTGGVNGPGVSGTEIKLGIPYCNDCAAGNAAAGAAGEDPGDTRRYYKAALDEVNARGGVLGRKLVAVHHEVSVSDDITASQQEACSTFTEDNKVFAIFFRGEIVYECARKAGIIAWGTGGSGETFARFPNLFAPSSIRFERLASVTVKAMVKAGWQKPEPKWPTGKIGIISWDNAEYKYAMNQGWLPALQAAGLKATDVKYVAIPQSANSLADSSSAVSSAVLSFRDQGIDHVFISDGPAGIFTGAGLTLQFLQNAKSQGYKPRYGFNTNNSPDFEPYPKDQLVGMLAIDSFSTAPANDAGIALNSQRERCFAVMRKQGLPVGQTQTQALAIGACEFAWFTEAIVKASRSTVLPDVIAGGEALGTSYHSPFSYGTRLARGQHDGVQLFRNLQFDEACTCLKYTSKPYEP